MRNSITGKKLLTMVNSVRKISRRREIQRKHARSMQALLSLMAFLEKEIQRYPSSTTSIIAVSIWSGMECGMSFTLNTHAIKRRYGILFYMSLNFPWNTWDTMYRVFWKSLRRISMLFRIWRGQECTWGVLYQILFFRRLCHWCRWQQPYLRSMLPPWLL